MIYIWLMIHIKIKKRSLKKKKKIFRLTNNFDETKNYKTHELVFEKKYKIKINPISQHSSWF